ncbi:hypothetical protein H6504_04515 [Candidatus Woesearchaeota archaeon]|nr:hypothetical protein [Candidatus Woesearchaeota archaeon]
MERLEQIALAASIALASATAMAGAPNNCDDPFYQNRIKQNSTWVTPNGNPTGIRKGPVADETKYFLEDVATCELDAKDPVALIARMMSGNANGTAKLADGKFTTDLGYDLDASSFGMSSGKGTSTTYAVSTKRPAGAQGEFTADIFVFQKNDGSDGYAALWEICGNMGAVTPLKKETGDFDFVTEPGYRSSRVQFSEHMGCKGAGPTVAVIPVAAKYNTRLGEGPQYATIDNVGVLTPEGKITDEGALSALETIQGSKVEPFMSLPRTMAFQPGYTEVHTSVTGKNGQGDELEKCDAFSVNFTPGKYRSGEVVIKTRDATTTQKFSELGVLQSATTTGPSADAPDCNKFYNF